MTHSCEHLVHVHRDGGYLLDALAAYFEEGAAAGEAGVAVAQPALRAALAARVPGLRLLDAEETLARFMRAGRPDWGAFRDALGGLLPAGARVYGEMVDVLWERGERDAAIRLEEFWNDLARLQAFSLFCAYRLDPLEDLDALERICSVHSHLAPAREQSRLDAAVAEASAEVLQRPLAEVVLSLAGAGRGRRMPVAHATLLWLARNMPRAGGEVLARVRGRVEALPA